MGYGKKAARNIDARLLGESRIHTITPALEYSQAASEEVTQARRHTSSTLAVAARDRSFAEVVTGLTQEEAVIEARRCLRCDIRENGHG
jgi:NADH-quinone oxidoreductase subunit F